jgi:hypothetical protein
MEPDSNHDAPVSRIQHFIQSVKLIVDELKENYKNNRALTIMVQGSAVRATPYVCICIYMHVCMYITYVCNTTLHYVQQHCDLNISVIY